MAEHSLRRPIEDLWEQRESLTSATKGVARDAVEAALEAMDNGTVRAAEKTDGGLFFNKTQLQCGDYNFYAYKNCKAYRPLDWNAIEATVQNGVARCTCNGELLTDSLKIAEPGQLGFEADKGAISYRHIRIKALP